MGPPDGQRFPSQWALFGTYSQFDAEIAVDEWFGLKSTIECYFRFGGHHPKVACLWILAVLYAVGP